MTTLHSKLLFSSVILCVLLGSSLVASVNAASIWNRTYGGEWDDWAYSLVATPDGGYAMAGTRNFGSGDYEFWLVKTDALGNVEWNKTYGGGGAYALVATPDGGYALAGGSVLIKTDTQGTVEWSKTYSGVHAYALIVTSDGGYALTGETLLVKTDALGNMQWKKTYGGSIRSLVATPDGGYAVAGYKYIDDVGAPCNFWLVKTDSNGVVEWEKTYGDRADSSSTMITEQAFALAVASDGGYALAGYKEILHNVIPLDETEPLKQIAASEGENPPNGDVFPEDIWFVKTDATGNMQWNKTYGGAESDTAYSVIATPDGGYIVGGFTDSFGPGGALLFKMNASGNIEWSRTYGEISYSTTYSVVATSDGGYALAGNSVPVGGTGYADFCLLKTDENGIVPEYSSLLVPTLMLTATAFILIGKKRLLRRSL